MLRLSLVSMLALALLSGPLTFAKGDGGNGSSGGNAGGGGSQGHGDGGGGGYGSGGPGGGSSQGNGNSGNDGGGNAASGGSHGNSNSGGLGGADGSQGSGGSGGSPSSANSGGISGSLGGGLGSGSPGSSGLSGAASAATDRSLTTDIATSTTASLTSLGPGGSNAEPTLPVALVPRLEGFGPRTASFGGLVPRGSVPVQLVQACRVTIIKGARPYGVVRVDAASAGPVHRLRHGGLAAPLTVRVEYARANARQIRQSRVSCQLDAAGAVVALR